ncbi:PTS sugar transporter subunit IIC [candidate division KSB1 bacterium]|nr:PTS sugar transporter subunit IIC [candidate division KSB1 bacterium]
MGPEQQILLVGLVGGVVALDTTAAWQIMISQPIICCPLIGFLLGDPQTGLIVGLLMEFLWLAFVPTGASFFPDGNLGSLVTAALASVGISGAGPLSPMGFFVVMAYGIALSYLGGKVIVWKRKWNGKRLHRWEGMGIKGNLKRFSLSFSLRLLETFIIGFLFAGIMFWWGWWLLPKLIRLIPSSFNPIFLPLKAALLGLGGAVMLKLFYSRRKMAQLGVGLVVGMVLALSF